MIVCSPKKLDVQGRDLKDVCLLRTPDEANYIAAAGKDKNIVIVGASFLGSTNIIIIIPQIIPCLFAASCLTGIMMIYF